jgi:LmbE family N-acetylglucosaminyl deacetylase
MQGPAEPQIDREYQSGGTGGVAYNVPVTVERKKPGKPHAGKVFAAIQPHCDDVPIFAGGLCLKLIDEGYTGYLITLSNDSMAGTGPSIGDIVYKNEQDTYEVGRRLKCKESFFLNYPNHNMDAWPLVEIRARLIFLFRVLKVDTVIVYDPSSLYERNPDHVITAKAVESAFWMASSRWDYPEHFKAGLTPHGPQDAYYFARGPQIVNRVVDVTDYIDGKVHANLANVTQGPAGNNGAFLKAKLAAQGKKLPILGNDDETANKNYTKYFALSRDRVRGKQHGVKYAEVYHYVSRDESPIDEYISQNAVPL